MKKRVMLTLTEEHVKKFQDICEKANLPPGTMSWAVDDFLHDVVGVMEKAMAKGSFTIKDMFFMMGDQLEMAFTEAENDAKEAYEKAKGKGPSKGGRPKKLAA